MRAFLVLLAITAIKNTAFAQSPPGFAPPVSQRLNVRYEDINVCPAGLTVPINAVDNTPELGLEHKETGPFIAVMMDFSVQQLNASNQTLLHWIQPDLTAHEKVLKSCSQAVVPYLEPSPPPGQTHTYGILLYTQPDPHFQIPDEFTDYFKNLTMSVNNRIGFPLDRFVSIAHLERPVAANFFLVSSPKNSSTSGT